MHNTTTYHAPRPGTKISTLNAQLTSIGFFLFCISELFLAQENPLSLPIKIIGFSLITSNIFIRPKIDRKAILLAPLFIILAINYYTSFDHRAATEELLRFLFPITILLNLYKNRSSLKSIAHFFIIITISNNIYQIYAYFAHLGGLPTLLPPRFEAGYIIRAQGWVGFFSLFGFMNFCAFLITRHTDTIKSNRKLLSYFFAVFSALSLSAKVIMGFIIYFILTTKGKNTIRTCAFSLVVLSAIVISPPKIITELLEVTDSKISFYIIEGNSARSESYRVMAQSLVQPNILGEGLGSFGGPASTKYGSPLYSKYNFNWYGLEGQLATTDTLYPHVFVELGLLGGASFLAFLFMYGQKRRSTIWRAIVVIFLLDNLVSFSILSPPYFFSAALCMIIFSAPTAAESHHTPSQFARSV